MIHPILFTLYLAYSGTPNAYEIVPGTNSGYEVTVLDPWSGAKAGRFSAAGYKRTDGRYTFLSYGDPTQDKEWRLYLKGHNGLFPACSQGGFELLWVGQENIHILRFVNSDEVQEKAASLRR